MSTQIRVRVSEKEQKMCRRKGAKGRGVSRISQTLFNTYRSKHEWEKLSISYLQKVIRKVCANSRVKNVSYTYDITLLVKNRGIP